MGFQVVCISSVDGSGSEQIGPLVAERLGYRVINEEIVAMAAQQADLAPELVADVERRKGLMGRVLDRLGSTPAMTASMGIAHMPMAIEETPTDAAMRTFIRAAIEEVASQGRAVIVAHAASFALAQRADTLRVFLTASPSVREARTGQDAKQLAKFDVNRADYLKRFYDIAAEQPSHYDLVLNTDRLEPKVAADIVAGLARA